MIRCPGKLPPGVGNMGRKLSFNDMELVSYLPPQELTENCTEIGEPITRIAQIFGHEIGLPHLLQLQTHLQSCNANVGQAESQLKPETTQLTPLVPPPESTSSSMYRFPCYSHDVFIQLLAQNCFNTLPVDLPIAKRQMMILSMKLKKSTWNCLFLPWMRFPAMQLPLLISKHLLRQQPHTSALSPSSLQINPQVPSVQTSAPSHPNN